MGQFVQPGSDLGTLVAADSARIRMGLLPDDIALVGQAEATIGSTVQLFASGPAGAPLGSGTVTQVSPEIEEQTRTLPLIVAVEDPFGDRLARPLRIDELVRLELPVTLPDGGAVRIPAAALKGADTLWRVADGRLQRLSPTVLVREADALVVVADRIAAGDTVMISDLPAAFDGQEVRTDDGTTDGEGG
jgi:multidrug efflux pump subunit AcrA (membrane-fusion protein)